MIDFDRHVTSCLIRVPDTEDILKTKEQKPWNNTKHIFSLTENKEDQRDLLFLYVIRIQLRVEDKVKIGEVKGKL